MRSPVGSAVSTTKVGLIRRARDCLTDLARAATPEQAHLLASLCVRRRASPPSASSRPAAVAIATVCSAACVLLFASPATASTRAFIFSFGAVGSTPANPYPLSQPSDVAVDQGSRDIYVADPGNHRVEMFDSSGHLILMFGKGVNKTRDEEAGSTEARQNICTIASGNECQPGVPGSGPGAFLTPTFVAVDNSNGSSNGDVYVGDTSDNLVSKFEPSGELIAAWGNNGAGESANGQMTGFSELNGIAVDPSGSLFVLDGSVSWYEQNGSLHSTFSAPRATSRVGLAVDSEDHLYKTAGSTQVVKFSDTGEGLGEPDPNSSTTGLTIDPTTNDLYVIESGSFVSHFELNCGTECTPLDSFGSGDLSGAEGISIDAASDDVYIANAGENDVAVFEGHGPYITTGAATSVGRSTATVNGHLEPGGRGEVTDCHFEYGTGLSYDDGSVPCEPAAPYESSTEVSAQLAGLQAETTYHYRIVATSATGTAYGVDRTFTPHFVLGVSTDPVSNLTNNSADLNGSYLGDGTDTHYYFDYGTDTSYGQITSNFDNGTGTGHQAVSPAAISELQPGTLYHYRIVASNSFGTTYGQDQTFTTSAKPAIESLFTSHLTATAADLHAVINPRGGATKYHFEYGTTNAYGATATGSEPEILSNLSLSHSVEFDLTNLQSGVTYHFRVVAENQYGTTVSEDQTFGFYPPACPNAHLRQITDSSNLPDCRAYELVSPANAGGAVLFPEAPNSPEATSPARLAFGGFINSIPGTGNPPNTNGDLYVATRTDEGWVTKYVGFPANRTFEDNGPPDEPRSTDNQLLTAPGGVRADTSMDKFLDWNDGIGSIESEFVGPVTYPPEFTPHVWGFDGSELGEWPTVAGYKGSPPGHLGSPIFEQSADFSHYVFQVGTPPDLSLVDNDTVANTATYVSRTPSGESIPVQPGDADPNEESLRTAAVSTDGSHILMAARAGSAEDPAIAGLHNSKEPCGIERGFFSGPDLLCPLQASQLYMRVNDSVTYEIAPGHAVNYVNETPNGSKVYFTTSEQLTPNDLDTSTDLYMWSAEKAENGEPSLTLLSIGNNGVGNSDACHASWTAKCDIVPYVNNSYYEPTVQGYVGGNGLSDNSIASHNGDVYFFRPSSSRG